MIIIQVYMKARVTASILAALVLSARSAPGQSHASHSDTSKSVGVGAQAIGLMTRQSPALAGSTFTEAYLTQPTLMAHARLWSNIATIQGMLSLEGLTLERGELNPGIVGEGYIDRRHPHTYLHELTGTLERAVGGARASLTIGKGFAPFGTDDPMVRPFVKYPINHHLAQILERIVAIATVRAGPTIIEAGAFNGDEPESSGDAPNSNRLWDSWSARATLLPIPGAELQASFARVRSPEIAAGGGPDDRKWSVSARFADPDERRYALAEWARTTDFVQGTAAFSFSSFLIESEAPAGPLVLAGRLEVTERPDEERLADPFRTLLSGHDFSILGRSRWTIASVRAAAPFVPRFGPALSPFAELAFHRVSETLRPSGFVPAQFYGSNRIWMVSLGAKLAIGELHRRMGRYGAAIPAPRGTNADQPVPTNHDH